MPSRLQNLDNALMYKILFTDIDGTLLKDDLTVGRKTIEALSKARDNGMIIAIASGRYLGSLDKFEALLGFPVMKVALNGGAIEDESGKRLYEKRLDRSSYRAAVDFLYGKAENVMAFASRSYAIDCDDVWYEKQAEVMKAYGIRMDIHDRDKVTEALGEAPFKALAKDRDWDVIDRLLPQVRAVTGDAANVVSSGRGIIEILPKDMDKRHGVRMAGEILGIKPEEMIAFGDWDNDIGMLSYVGMGVVMANGSEGAKKAARMETLSNNDDGIAYALEKMGLA